MAFDDGSDARFVCLQCCKSRMSVALHSAWSCRPKLPGATFSGSVIWLHSRACRRALLTYRRFCLPAVSTAKPTPLSEVTYVDKIRAMSALFSVGDLKLQEVNPGALHAVAVSLKDGSLFAGNHYADSLTEV